MTVKFDSLYKDAVGANNYDLNDPIVGFINDLKVLNADHSRLNAAATSSAMKSSKMTSQQQQQQQRDRKKTYSSLNSSDFDSSMSGTDSMHSYFSEIDEFDDDEEYDEDEEEDEDELDEDDVVDDLEEDRDNYGSDSIEQDKPSRSSARQASAAAANKNKKFKRN